MSFIPSLVCYNFLEAFLLLLACYLFRNNKYKYVKFNLKKFVVSSYVLGFINLLIQYPMNMISNPILYMIYNILMINIVESIVLCVYANKYIIKTTLSKCIIINVLYCVSIIIMINYFSFKFIIDYNLNIEFCINIIMKLIQFLILIGVYFMKNFLIKMAKKSTNKNIAATYYGYGEPELHESLKQEIIK